MFLSYLERFVDIWFQFRMGGSGVFMFSFRAYVFFYIQGEVILRLYRVFFREDGGYKLGRSYQESFKFRISQLGLVSFAVCQVEDDFFGFQEVCWLSVGRVIFFKGCLGSGFDSVLFSLYSKCQVVFWCILVFVLRGSLGGVESLRLFFLKFILDVISREVSLEEFGSGRLVYYFCFV